MELTIDRKCEEKPRIWRKVTAMSGAHAREYGDGGEEGEARRRGYGGDGAKSTLYMTSKCRT
jgi:hypothetical protein